MNNGSNNKKSKPEKGVRIKGCDEHFVSSSGACMYLLIKRKTSEITDSYGSLDLPEFESVNTVNTYFYELLSDKSQQIKFREWTEYAQEKNTPIVFETKTVKKRNLILKIFPSKRNDNFLIKVSVPAETVKTQDTLEEQDCKSIAEYAADAFLVGNNQGQIIRINTRFSDLTGYSFEDVKNKHISVIFSDSSLNKTPLQFKNLDAGETVMNERQIIRNDKQLIDIEMNTRRIDETGYLSIIRDISSRKSMQKALSENQERYNKLFTNSPLGILYCNNQGQIIEVNNAFLGILESPSKEFIKKINLLNFKPLNDNGFSDTLEKAFENKTIITKEFEYTSRWGSHSFVKNHFIPLQDKSGNFTTAFVIGEDITKQRYFIEELKKAKDKALESERLKSAFLSNISHEIRTPLNAVLGFAQLFDCDEYSNEELMRFKGSIIKGSNNLLNLIEGIIKLSELQSGHVEINKEKISIDFLMNNLVKYGKTEIQSVSKDIQLLYEYSSLEKFIESDEVLLDRVMKHLINNAVKFTDSGFIKIGVYTKNGNIIFFVQDSGIGISDKQKKYIFDKFRQAESPEADIYRGVGMGLALSKEIIDKLNGKISIHSEIGNGSTFEVILPKN